MDKKQILNKIKSLAFLSSLYLLIYLISNYIIQVGPTVSSQLRKNNYDSRYLKLISFGEKRMISNFLWINSLLDSDIDHYKKNDYLDWFYLKINTITDLEPYFYNAYLFGTQYLGIIKNDVKAALKISLKGLKKFPNDYHLNYFTAFLYYIELKDPKSASFYYDKIKNYKKATALVKLLASRTYFESNSFKNALTILEDLLANSNDDKFKNRIILKIEKIKKAMK